MDQDRLVGQIRKLIPDKYCGFIFVDGAPGDYFFHVSGMQSTTTPYLQLREGMAVEFTPIEGPKGLRAIEVRVI